MNWRRCSSASSKEVDGLEAPVDHSGPGRGGFVYSERQEMTVLLLPELSSGSSG